MKDETVTAMRADLTRIIGQWWDENGYDEPPYVGENFAAILADAAVTVVRGMADAEDYLRVQEMIE